MSLIDGPVVSKWKYCGKYFRLQYIGSVKGENKKAVTE